MKTKLSFAICAGLVLSTASIAALATGQSNPEQQTVQTTETTTTTTKHIPGTHEVWYKEGGVVPTEYRGDTYVVTTWKTQHLNEPVAGSHWVRGDNGDFLLVDEKTGTIANIIHPNQSDASDGQ